MTVGHQRAFIVNPPCDIYEIFVYGNHACELQFPVVIVRRDFRDIVAIPAPARQSECIEMLVSHEDLIPTNYDRTPFFIEISIICY